MLSEEENKLLTRVGPGTFMGDLLRQYWQPFFLSHDLPQPECPPVRVRLLGEDLIVFRDTSGKVGLLGNHCPHRGASLFFGRNEENGLRCVYHGWKFDVHGNCVDMPNELPESHFKDKIHHTAYPCRERNGVVWAYMGPLADPPDLPQVEWNMVPEAHVYCSIRIAENNFMQPIEGEYDTTHIGFLHQRSTAPWIAPGTPDEHTWGFIARKYKAPRFEVSDTDYGVLIGTRRDLEDRQHSYWRVYPFLMPFHTLIPGGGDDPNFSGHAWIPMDDEHTICLCWDFNAVRPLTEQELARLKFGADGLEGLHPTVDVFQPAVGNRPYPRYWPKLDYEHDFGVDYEAQKNQRFSGLPGTWPQDSGMQQSMGRIVDRTIEHLGTADTGQIAIRRRMLRAARELREQGTPPPGALNPEVFWLRPVSTLLPTRTISWVEAIKEQMEAGGRIKGTRVPNGLLLGGDTGARQGA